MKLIDDWKVVLRKAWSLRFTALGVLLGIAEQTVPALQGQISTGTYIFLFSLVGMARLIQQESMHAADPDGKQ